MSITRDHGEIVLECDKCSETIETGEEDFNAAWNEAKTQGWRAYKEDDEWCHSCPACVSGPRLL